jgi:hypothetical protein
MEKKKFIIFEIISGLLVIGLVLTVFFVDLDLGIFKIISQKNLVAQYNSLKELDTKLLTAKTNYDTSVKAVETSKSDYKRQKDQYDAITDETIAVIKEATTEEKYNIEYMWIKLGNYATANNLTLSLVEPGGSSQVETPEKATTTQTTNTTTQTTDDNTNSAAGNTNTPAPSSNTASSGELSISVKGNYLNVSEFIFELENDGELRFKLDKIKMEYAGNNQITATFAVKNLKFVK